MSRCIGVSPLRVSVQSGEFDDLTKCKCCPVKVHNRPTPLRQIHSSARHEDITFVGEPTWTNEPDRGGGGYFVRTYQLTGDYWTRNKF